MISVMEAIDRAIRARIKNYSSLQGNVHGGPVLPYNSIRRWSWTHYPASMYWETQWDIQPILINPTGSMKKQNIRDCAVATKLFNSELKRIESDCRNPTVTGKIWKKSTGIEKTMTNYLYVDMWSFAAAVLEGSGLKAQHRSGFPVIPILKGVPFQLFPKIPPVRPQDGPNSIPDLIGNELLNILEVC